MSLTRACHTSLPRLRRAALALGAMLSVSWPAAGAAQTTSTPGAAPTTSVPIFRLSRTALQEPAQKPKKAKDDWRFRWEDHPTLRLGLLRVGFRARFQKDIERSDAATGDTDELTADVARRRIGIAGEIVKYASFQVERELADDEDPWRDVYINYEQFGGVQVQVGKFKLPFSLDENTSATNLDFVHRSRAADTLAPGRDVGSLVHGRLLNRTLGFELGVFEHDGRNAKPKHADRVIGGQTLAGRVSLQPFHWSKSSVSDLEVGAAFTRSDVPDGLSGLRGETVLGAKFFTSDYFVQGTRRRLGLEMRWRPGPVSLQWERITATDQRLGESVEDGDLPPIRAVGWYLSGTVAVTGDKKSGGLDTPKHPLFQGGAGAIELAARIERLTFDSAPTGDLPSTSPRSTVILGNSDRVLTLGVNWYPNRWVKVQFNFIRETLADPDLGPLPEASSFSSRVVRFQFSL